MPSGIEREWIRREVLRKRQSHEERENMCCTQAEYDALLIMNCQPVCYAKGSIDIADAFGQFFYVRVIEQGIFFGLDLLRILDCVAAELVTALENQLMLCR